MQILSKAYQILEEITKDEYGIDEKRILFLFNLLKFLQIECDDALDSISIHTYQGEKICDIDIRGFPSCFVMQYPPILVSGEFVFSKPVLKMTMFKDKGVLHSSLYHEISHLFSIGRWRINENKAYHNSGMLEEVFCYQDSCIEKIESKYEFLAEELNDWIAMNLYQKIEKERYSTNKKRGKEVIFDYISHQVMKNCSNNLKSFFGYYFSNNVSMIKSILCSDELKDFEELDRYFKEQLNICL